MCLPDFIACDQISYLGLPPLYLDTASNQILDVGTSRTMYSTFHTPHIHTHHTPYHISTPTIPHTHTHHTTYPHPHTKDGYTYERSAITGWLSKGRRTSPVTNLPLPTTLLIPNRLVKTLIDKQNKSWIYLHVSINISFVHKSLQCTVQECIW